ncbi:hypothetical protein ACZ90_31910 [Streptomyces albus subsp. albus]|nr:hypothetical protein ACZ90_31910 [Streptomyces albus subsp. albus]
MQAKRGLIASVAAVVLAGAATVAAAPAPAAAAPAATAVQPLLKDPAYCGFDNAPTPITIKEGATGPTVMEAQCLLQLWGFSVGPRGVDGIFGPLTTSATKMFQTSRGLAVDGIIGPDTWFCLRDGCV